MSLLKKYPDWFINTLHKVFPNFCSCSLSKIQYNNCLPYSAATHFTKEIFQQTSACQNPHSTEYQSAAACWKQPALTSSSMNQTSAPTTQK